MARTPESKTPVSHGWRPWQLKWGWFVTNLIAQAAFIISVAILTWLSATKDGFRTVQYTPLINVSDISWANIEASQLWWTLIPPLAITILKICYGTIVGAAAERQPFVELNHFEKDARNAGLTIMLDYPSCAGFYSWAVAFGNRHFRLGLAMLVQQIILILLVPLSGNLFRTHGSQASSPVTLESPEVLEVSRITTGADLEPAFDVVNAIHLYGAAPPTWMRTDVAINPFTTAQQNILGNISVETMIYWASLDCRYIAPAELNRSFTPTDVVGTGEATVGFKDRGCNISNQTFPVSSAYKAYALTWHQDCPLVGLENWDVRLGVFLGTYSTTDEGYLSDFIAVSCIPSYYNASATVSMAFTPNNRPEIISISTITKYQMLQVDFRALHASLGLYSTLDISSAYKSDAFGRIVNSLARILSQSSGLDQSFAVNATETVYATLYAALVETELLASMQTPIRMQGVLNVAITRLSVVIPIAYVVLALLLLMLISTIGLFIHALNSNSVLKEDPTGLLGKAAVLLRSNIFTSVSDILRDNPDSAQAVKIVESRYDINQSKCFFDNQEGANTGEVIVQNLLPIDPPPQPRWATRTRGRFSHASRRPTQTTVAQRQPESSIPLLTHRRDGDLSNAAASHRTSAISISPAAGGVQESGLDMTSTVLPVITPFRANQDVNGMVDSISRSDGSVRWNQINTPSGVQSHATMRSRDGRP